MDCWCNGSINIICGLESATDIWVVRISVEVYTSQLWNNIGIKGIERECSAIKLFISEANCLLYCCLEADIEDLCWPCCIHCSIISDCLEGRSSTCCQESRSLRLQEVLKINIGGSHFDEIVLRSVGVGSHRLVVIKGTRQTNHCNLVCTWTLRHYAGECTRRRTTLKLWAIIKDELDSDALIPRYCVGCISLDVWQVLISADVDGHTFAVVGLRIKVHELCRRVTIVDYLEPSTQIKELRLVELNGCDFGDCGWWDASF